MGREIIETILTTHDHDIEAAIASLQELCLTDAPMKHEPSAGDGGSCTASEAPKDDAGRSSKSRCVDILVQEMACAVDMADARRRAARVMDMFEGGVVAAAEEKAQGIASMNNVLKKAVVILHKQSLAQREALEDLRRAFCLCQQQLRTSEIDNYALKLRLNSLENCAAPAATFAPDVF